MTGAIMWSLILLSVMTGCNTEVACTDLAAVSVSVSVVDGNGAPVSGALVSWDSGNGPQSCDSLDGSTYLCAYEVKGEIAIHVEAAGYQAVDQVVSVEADECHVIGESVQIALDGVECTEVEVPAVVATVVDAGGAELSNVVVQWGLANADMAPQPCDVQGDGSWTCAPEQVGDIEVYAVADGHEAQMQTVTVGMDEVGCHPLTQSLSFALEWLPD